MKNDGSDRVVLSCSNHAWTQSIKNDQVSFEALSNTTNVFAHVRSFSTLDCGQVERCFNTETVRNSTRYLALLHVVLAKCISCVLQTDPRFGQDRSSSNSVTVDTQTCVVL